MRRKILFLLPILVLGGSLGSIKAQDIDFAKGIQAYYTFHNKQLSSQTVEVPAVFLNQAEFSYNRFGDAQSTLKFDGQKQSARIPHHPRLDLDQGDGYTLSLWIKPKDSNTGCLLLKESDFGIKWNGLRAPLTVFDGLNGGYPRGKFKSWNTNQWYHLLLVKSKDKLKLFINGVLDKEFPVSPKSILPSKDIFIGKHPYFWGGFTGYIDDIVLYDRPLNAYEASSMSQIENIPLESFTEEVTSDLKLTDFIGTWQGVITQPGNDMVENYTFWIQFSKTKDGILKGYTRIEVPEDKAFGVTTVQGIISGKTLSFEEIQVYRQKNYLGYKWCKKFGQLTLDPETRALKGKWFANNCQINGELLLYPSRQKFNFFDNRNSPKVSLDELMVKLEKNKSEGTVQPSQANVTKVSNEKAPEAEVAETSFTLDVEPLYFKFASALLTNASEDYIKKEIIPLFKKYPELKANIKGFTDSSGNDQLNLTLSTNRAKEVYKFFITQGISKSRMDFQGFGEANPIATNTTKEGRAANRRVEIEVSY